MPADTPAVAAATAALDSGRPVFFFPTLLVVGLVLASKGTTVGLIGFMSGSSVTAISTACERSMESKTSFSFRCVSFCSRASNCMTTVCWRNSLSRATES
jgi:hypothetical protein